MWIRRNTWKGVLERLDALEAWHASEHTYVRDMKEDLTSFNTYMNTVYKTIPNSEYFHMQLYAILDHLGITLNYRNPVVQSTPARFEVQPNYTTVTIDSKA